MEAWSCLTRQNCHRKRLTLFAGITGRWLPPSGVWRSGGAGDWGGRGFRRGPGGAGDPCPRGDLQTELPVVFEELRSTRPTAVNLFWALDRMARAWQAQGGTAEPATLVSALEAEALRLYREDAESNRRLGEFGATLLADGMNILTICNAGALATVAYGTALAVVRMAVAQGKKIAVTACETRPLLQGARLTTWELLQEGIPVTLITDSMAGYVMQRGLVQAVITGADRVAANGDVVNKIGTYTLAVLAREHGLPFYVAAPFSTVDLAMPEGSASPSRNGRKMRSPAGRDGAWRRPVLRY